MLAIRVRVNYEDRSDLNNNFELQVIYDSGGPQFETAIQIASLPYGEAAKGFNFTLPDILFDDQQVAEVILIQDNSFSKMF